MEACILVVRLLLVITALIPIATCIDSDFTIEVKPGMLECFFQSIKVDTTIEVEYQVIDGGDLDIGFSAHTPEGQLLAADGRKTENVHRFDVKGTGDFKFCLDNTFSRLSKKVVYFELMTDEEEEDDWKPDKDELAELVDMTMEDFKSIMTNVKTNLEKSQQLQNLLKNFEARDRNIQENNFTRVNLLSGFQLIVMISVGLTQVLMIRSLFSDPKSAQTMRART
ncbi:transmembrane emp24 domain-containing protein 5-like [Haliotis rufescens]|uniref:transmembrane emp24 domain-containing protein 5-like n=1 Tax=Haliotis rufescens TaxID=6454 RepID=UPI001EB0199D|nr:transmembrane emp24 domain-containing protein 5-like [Haliotis rufescens]